jgi:hypothetical protein
MPIFDRTGNAFRAAPIIDQQIFVATEKPEVPASYRLSDLGGAWLASDAKLPITAFKDSGGRGLGWLVGHCFSEFHGEFLKGGEVSVPGEVATPEEFELRVLNRLSGMFVFLTSTDMPQRLYMDPGASFPIVYTPTDRRAASSVALLLTEQEYKDRFLTDLHEALIVREGTGSWITGGLTAHRGVRRVLANHYLDLDSWTTHRFWPRLGDFAQWRDFGTSVDLCANAITEFTNAASRGFRLGSALTAGFDTRMLVASSRHCLPRVQFFTLEAPNAEMDTDVAHRLAERFGLSHRVLPLHDADQEALEIWDRMVSDCMLEHTRRTHITLRDLTDVDAVMAGLFGETARCRLYRQDYATINEGTIDSRFLADRLTVPPHPALLEAFDVWLGEIQGQPNSVIMEMAFVELKVGIWAMGQRPMTNSLKLNLLPFAQRRVLDAFVGVAPAEKGTKRLFQAVLERQWSELMEFPINKYGDLRDRLTVFKKLTDANKVRRYLRDRFAKKKMLGG